MTKLSPKIIPPADHPLSPGAISPSALKVAEGLRADGYDGLLVGGCVRDLVLGREPKDFDVVTDARPEEVRRVFRRARLIGRRFRLAHVRMGREIIEVATYRAIPDADSDVDWEDGDTGNGHEDAEPDAGDPQDEFPGDDADAVADENIYGTREEDARRRDFTVNALYYDPVDGNIIDYVGGMEDLRAGVLRVIGDPESRYREDPVRMLRAIRFAARLGFRIDPATEAPLAGLAPLLRDVPPARLFDEVLKLFHGGYALETWELLRKYHLFEQLFPMTDDSLAVEREGFPVTLLPMALRNTDTRVSEDKPVTPAFLFAALLWEPVRLVAERLQRDRQMSEVAALQEAGEEVLARQLRQVAIPRRFSFPMREIWIMQTRFARRNGQRAFRLLEQKRFRAAYDFLLLRAETGEEDPELAQWWTRFQEVDDDGRRQMVAALGHGGSTVGRRRRRPRRRSKSRTVH